MELENYIDQINNKIEVELLNVNNSSRLVNETISKTLWFPHYFKDHLNIINTHLIEIFTKIKTIKADNFNKVNSLRLANLLNAYLQHIIKEDNFLKQTMEDIALAQIWYDSNVKNEELSSKTFEFFLSKNQFTEGIVVENSNKLLRLFSEFIDSNIVSI